MPIPMHYATTVFARHRYVFELRDVSDDTCEPLADGTATSCAAATPMEGSNAGVCQPDLSDTTETDSGEG